MDLLKLHRGRTALALLLVAGLAGCGENGFQFGGGSSGDTETAAASADAPRTELVERDVEAPDVFQVSDRGLWDGRPSLGGVWVAHPDVTDPERVIIRNTENGKFVIGALFRRERESAGPDLQVSSDAADALGMLAGAPAELNVTALRREEAPVETPPAATTDFDAPTDISAAPLDGGEVTATPLDPIAGASAAIDAAEAAAPAAAPAPAPAAAPPPAPTSSSLSKPYIQIGIFSVEANANRTADMMRTNGLVPTVLSQESQGKPFWRVIVGPAATEAERADLLSKIKGMGFADAYFVGG